MKYIFWSFALFCCSTSVHAQYKMRPVHDLIVSNSKGIQALKEWTDSATNHVEILPVDTSKSKEALYKCQITSNSLMGAIVYSTGGILIDHGWLRLLGGGSTKMQRTLPDWNLGKAFENFGDQPAYFLVADDAVGGFFAINYGNFGKDLEKIYYLSPRSLSWQPLGIYYEEFVMFCFAGNLDDFYKNLRWSSWKSDVATMNSSQSFIFFPPLFTEEGKDIDKNAKNLVPTMEIFSRYMKILKATPK